MQKYKYKYNTKFRMYVLWLSPNVGPGEQKLAPRCLQCHQQTLWHLLTWLISSPTPHPSINTTITAVLFPTVIVSCQLLLQLHLATRSFLYEFPLVYLILCASGLLKTTQICYSHDLISTLTRPPCTLQTSLDSDHPSLSSAQCCELKSLSCVSVWL